RTVEGAGGDARRGARRSAREGAPAGSGPVAARAGAGTSPVRKDMVQFEDHAAQFQATARVEKAELPLVVAEIGEPRFLLQAQQELLPAVQESGTEHGVGDPKACAAH